MLSSPRLSAAIRFFVLLVLLVSLLPPTRTARAASFTVNSLADNNTGGDGFCTLREAIESANNAGNGDCGLNSPANDTISFSVSGTITLGSTLPAIISGQGTLTVNGGGNITISGNNSVRVMRVDSGANLTLQNLTIANGFTSGDGGGIYNHGALTVIGSAFSGNSASRRGGGIASLTAFTVSDSLFDGNTASGNNTFDGGGAIHTEDNLTIQNTTFRANRYTGDSHGGGAILTTGGILTINDSLFEGNEAGGNGGGAIALTLDFFAPPSAQIARSTFRNNRTLGGFGEGGAIYANGALDVWESTFDGNRATGNGSSGFGNGGGIIIINNPLYLKNVTMSGNRANGNGGAVYYRADDSALLTNVTIASNLADADANGSGSGGGIFSTGDGTGGAVELRLQNAILSGNTGGAGPDCSGFITSTAGYNLIQTPGALCTLGGITTGNLIGVNPNLGPLANNGGSTPTRALLAGSPAIDAADPGASCPAADQRGVARFDGNYDSVVRCDIGAYEFNQPATPAVLPNTGFAPGRITHLPAQPLNAAYQSYSSLTLELPTLKVSAPIVGVLKSNGSWDVSWLGNSVGWLEGSAFPTWQGNTVLTGHVWNADNTPGIFAEIRHLKYGDRFYIHAFGQTYMYEVRENTWLWGASRVDKVFKHEELDWVTLLTCEGYNPLNGNYLFRRMVRAVLVEIK